MVGPHVETGPSAQSVKLSGDEFDQSIIGRSTSQGPLHQVGKNWRILLSLSVRMSRSSGIGRVGMWG